MIKAKPITPVIKNELFDDLPKPTDMDLAVEMVRISGINACDRFSTKVNGIEYGEVVAYMYAKDLKAEVSK